MTEMKKVLSIISAVLIIVGILSFSAVLADNNITVEIDGNKLETDVAPIIINNRTMMPLRAVFEALDSKVDWDENLRKITATKNDVIITLTVDSEKASIGTEEVTLDSVPVIIEGRTLVPVRFICEAMGCMVDWDGEKRLVLIKTKPAKANESESYKVISAVASQDDGNAPENSVDGDWTTRWSGEGKDCWILYELEKAVPVGYVGIAWYSGKERQAKFDISVSTDGINFQTVSEDLLSPPTSEMCPYSLDAITAKYIKLDCHGNTQNFWNSIVEFKAYAPRGDSQMPVADAPPVDPNYIPKVVKPNNISDDVWDAVTRFDKVCGKNIIDFLISTYDPDTGGFTNSPSGVYTPGFEGELEATATWMASFPGMGLINTDFVSDPYVPEGFFEKMIEFYQLRQNPYDGYWYDPLYGNYMIETKRQRTSAKALSNLKQIGGEPLYKTYEDYINEAAKTNMPKEKMSTVADTSSLPDYFRSESAYISWLKNKNWTDGVYLTGNEITNSISTAITLGYGDAALKFILSKQNPVTGCWGVDAITSDTTNGALKLSDAIKQLGGKYPYVEQAVDTVITFIENETEPANLCTIWNPILLIVNIRATHNNKFPAEVQKKLDDKIVYLLNKTSEFLSWFQTPDGGYKYYLDIPMAEHGGVVSAVGLNKDGELEGNEDSTVIGSFLMRNSVYGAAGLAPTPIWAQYKEYFWQEIGKKMKASYKKKYEECEVYTEDFEDVSDVSELYDTWGFVLQGDAGENRAVKKDTADRKNKCLCVSTGPTVTTKGYVDYFNTNFMIPRSDEYTVEFRFMVDSSSTEPLFNIYIGSRAVALMLVKNETVGQGGSGMALTFKTDEMSYGSVLKTGLEKDFWYTLKVVYKPDKRDNTLTKIYLDGEKIIETDKYYNGGFAERFPVKTVRNITVMAYGRSCTAKFYMDDIKVFGNSAK